MKGLLLKAGKKTIKDYATVVEFNDELQEYYDMIGCDCIEIPERTIGGKMFSLVCDEEALMKDDPIPCCHNTQYKEAIFGNVLVTGAPDDAGNLTGLTDEDVELIMDNIFAAYTGTGRLLCITQIGLR